MIFKKTISLLLVGVLLLSSLTSCASAVDKRLDRAGKVLDKKPYIIEVEVDYSCDDSEFSGALEQLERTEVTLYSKDGNLRAEQNMAISYDGVHNTFLDVYTVIGDVVYYEADYVVDGMPKVAKSKALIDSEKTSELFGTLAVVGDVSAADFSDVIGAKRDGEYVITCRGASTDRVIELEHYLATLLDPEGESGSTVKATDIVLTIEIDGKKYETVTLECKYSLTIGGKSYTVGMTVELEFEYDESFHIAAPADASEYKDVNVDTIF